MRMTVWKEIRWLIAAHLFGLVVRLTQKEASNDMMRAQLALALRFVNDHSYDTIAMRQAKND